ncbi:hypothetical protein [Enterococcus termitis]|uniref:hypothetical protein n=1 Tax=Enterococcus termitis TaxID=332950 RepID=UPI00090EBEEA|nr:hypothetical protein [Enterococcus termitis]OJG97605.1 hypothetical protein RV18_GL000673 [Enterococcus termitis]
MITSLNFLRQCIESVNQVLISLTTMISKINIDYTLFIALFILVWEMMDLFLFKEE